MGRTTTGRMGPSCSGRRSGPSGASTSATVADCVPLLSTSGGGAGAGAAAASCRARSPALSTAKETGTSIIGRPRSPRPHDARDLALDVALALGLALVVQLL